MWVLVWRADRRGDKQVIVGVGVGVPALGSWGHEAGEAGRRVGCEGRPVARLVGRNGADSHLRASLL